MSQPTDRRFPARVFDHGAEPDPRFTLTDERTFLALGAVAVAGVTGVAVGR